MHLNARALETKTIHGSYSDSVTVGRGLSAQVSVGGRHRQVSRLHTTISWDAERGAFTAQVHGLNGMKVRDALVARGECAQLRDHDVLDLVGVRFLFRCPPTLHEVDAADTLSRFAHVASTKCLGESQHEGGGCDLESVDMDEFDAMLYGDEECRDGRDAASANPTDGPRLQQGESDEHPDNAETQDGRDAASASPSDDGPRLQQSESDRYPEDAEIAEMLVEAVVFSGKTSATITDIIQQLVSVHPAVWTCANPQDNTQHRERIQECLVAHAFFGRVERKVKDASNRRVEDKWYYAPDLDANELRRETFGGLTRQARRCTLRDNQYFFRRPPPLPYHQRKA